MRFYERNENEMKVTNGINLIFCRSFLLFNDFFSGLVERRSLKETNEWKPVH